MRFDTMPSAPSLHAWANTIEVRLVTSARTATSSRDEVSRLLLSSALSRLKGCDLGLRAVADVGGEEFALSPGD